TECDGTPDDRQLQITQRPDGRQCATDHHARAFDDRTGSTLRRSAGLGLDGSTAAICLEAALSTTDARPAIGFDHHMADVAGITDPALQELTAADDSAADARAHHHADEVAHADGAPA